MKKKIMFCLFVTSLVFGCRTLAEPLEVLNYSFEYNEFGEQVPGWVPGVTGTPQYWAYSSNCDDDTWEDASTDGIVSVAVGGTDDLFQLLDHKVYPGDEYLLRFDCYYAWAEGGIYDGTYKGKLYYDDDGGRIPIAVTGDAAGRPWKLDNDLKITVPAGSPAMGRKLGIELSTYQETGNWISLDNVRLDMLASPGRAHEPDPANGDQMVLLDKVLNWRTGVNPDNLSEPNPAITNHYVYMNNGSATDPNLTLVSTIPAGDPPAETAEYIPDEGLIRDGVYYWRVDEAVGSIGPDDPNIIRGMLWSFEAVKSVPMFMGGQPEDTAVWPAESVVLRVEAVNPYTLDTTDLIYAWYKAGDTIVLSETDTLEITNAQVADEGDYYCKVTVIFEETEFTAYSPTAQLIIKRLIGYWPFDGNMKDIAGGYDGTMIGGGASYEDGIIDSGEALEFTGNSKEAATFPTDAHINLAWSLSWWENSDPTKTGGDWETMVGCGGDVGWEIFDFTRYRAVRYAFGFETDGQQRTISGDYIFTVNDPALYPRGQWHYHVVTNEPSTQTATIYINGVKFDEFVGFDFDEFDEVLYLGNLRDMSQPYAGLIDDLKLYNYVLEPMDIANGYASVTGEEICVELPAGDTTGDCFVNISDLLEVIDSWLQCNLYPFEMCP
ncbi:MAG: hypothetical protein JSV03_09405 [Planctomycetota bacterium]|nr:MAG: hypothetical protein JSV03_09405 [Planctomycetota bacterium]